MSSRRRDNFGQFEKYATIRIQKELAKKAKILQENILDQVGTELDAVYKENLIQSFHARSAQGQAVEKYNAKKKKLEQQDKEEFGIKHSRRGRKKLTYRHADTLLNHVYVKRNPDSVQIVIEDVPYAGEGGIKTRTPITTIDIHTILTKGASGGGYYPYRDSDGEIKYAYNYPTPKHDFEERTQAHMNNYVRMIQSSIDQKYNNKSKKKK